MKILLHNIAYGTGLNGSWKQYFWKLHRYIWLPLYSGRHLSRTLKEQNADVYCLLEIDAGSLRNIKNSGDGWWNKANSAIHYEFGIKTNV